MYSEYLGSAEIKEIVDGVANDGYWGLGTDNIARMIKESAPELADDLADKAAERISQIAQRVIARAVDVSAAAVHARSFRPGDAVIDLRDDSKTLAYVTQPVQQDDSVFGKTTARVGFTSMVDVPVRYLRRA